MSIVKGFGWTVARLSSFFILGGCSLVRGFDVGVDTARFEEAAPPVEQRLSIGDAETLEIRRAQIIRQIEQLQRILRRTWNVNERAVLAGELNRQQIELQQINLMLGR